MYRFHYPFVKNRQKILIVITALLIFCYIFYSANSIAQSKQNEKEIKPIANKSIACHFIDLRDALPSAEDRSFSPPTNSIFFHETSCRGGLNSRQACSVESAARAHPHWQVHVLFSAPVNNLSLNKESLKQLKKYDNIHFARVHINEYVKGSPLESLVVGGALNTSLYPLEHAADMLRLMTLYKWGGVYLDLDIIVAKPLTTLANNWAAWDSPRSVGNGAMSFSKDLLGRIFATATIRILASDFKGDKWAHNGPGVIKQFLKYLCTTSNVPDMSASKCLGFEVYGPHLFYPITYMDSRKYFESAELNVSDPYTYHVFNSLTYNIKVLKNSSYVRLAKKYCPVIYSYYGDDFGI